MSDGQSLNIVITLVVGFVVGLIWINARIRNVQWIYFYGIGLLFLGVIGWLLMGRNLIQLILFRETTGFGRAFLAGAMMIVSGLVYSIYYVFARFFKR